jgi:drug/metabolite transporter (DMT)-like permease
MQYLFVSLTVVLWGLAFFIEKTLMSKLHPGYFQVIGFLTMFFLSPIYYYYAKVNNGCFPTSYKYLALAVVAFVFMNVGTAFLTIAYQYGNNAAVITAISNAYIVPMILCCVLFLGETILLRQYFGIVMILFGTALLIKY